MQIDHDSLATFHIEKFAEHTKCTAAVAAGMLLEFGFRTWSRELEKDLLPAHIFQALEEKRGPKSAILTVRAPGGLAAAVKTLARDEGISTSAAMVRLMSEALSKKDAAAA